MGENGKIGKILIRTTQGCVEQTVNGSVANESKPLPKDKQKTYKRQTKEKRKTNERQTNNNPKTHERQTKDKPKTNEKQRKDNRKASRRLFVERPRSFITKCVFLI